MQNEALVALAIASAIDIGNVISEIMKIPKMTSGHECLEYNRKCSAAFLNPKEVGPSLMNMDPKVIP